MIASKFVKCLNKLINLNPYYVYLPNPKCVIPPKFIPIKENNINEVEKLNIEKLCENLDLENNFKLRSDCNVSFCKSDISMLKGNNLNYPPACHSVPCCNSNSSGFSGTILKGKTKISSASLKDEKSTRNQSTSTAPVKECKSAIYIPDQPKSSVPIKPLSAPCRNFNHDKAVRELCEKALKTCSEARKIIYYYKYCMLKQEDWIPSEFQIENKATVELNDKDQNLPPSKTVLSNSKLNDTTCLYCTQHSSVSQNYSCPFCAKGVKNCTCIHCPHCKKSRITAPSRKPYQSRTKFFKFDAPLNCPLANKMKASHVTLQKKIKKFAEKHNPCDYQLESETFSHCKISKRKTEKLSLSKSENQQKRAKSPVDKNRKTKSLSHELKSKSANKKLHHCRLDVSPEPTRQKKKCNSILENKDFGKNLPGVQQQLTLPWITSYNTNEAKKRDKLLSELSPKTKKSIIKEQSLDRHLEKVFKSMEKKVISTKPKNVEKKQKDSSAPEVLKQSKDEKIKKKAINVDKKLDNSSECPVKLIYPVKANRLLPLNKNAISVRNYCSKQDDDSEMKPPKDVLCECPNALREVDKGEKSKYDEYFDGCYKNMEYFQYDKYSYFYLEECMQECRLPQPNSKEKYDDCD